MSYATYEDVQAGFRTLDESEIEKANALLDRAAIIIDSVAADGIDDSVKMLVSCNMVTRALGSGGDAIPIGVSQGTQTGLGYTASYTFGTGTAGELYLSKMDKRLLKCGNRIGSYSPVEEIADA